VDGNKRTALGTAVVFYRLNGYELRYAEELESMVRLIALREDMILRNPRRSISKPALTRSKTSSRR
jgi:prophage maintenance system killer protein